MLKWQDVWMFKLFKSYIKYIIHYIYYICWLDLVVVCCSDTRFEAVAQAMKDLDAAKASLERRAHGVNLTQNTSQIWHKCLNTQQIHCIWHHLTINSQIVEKSNELWWVTTYISCDSLTCRRPWPHEFDYSLVNTEILKRSTWSLTPTFQAIECELHESHS